MLFRVAHGSEGSVSSPGRQITPMNRWPDWWAQAQRDLRHARHALADDDCEWSAFAAQQAAEKAVKALIMQRAGEPWGHSVTMLLEALPEDVAPADPVVLAAKKLDKHYVPTRYPNGFDVGYPGRFYTREEAQEAIRDAGTVIDFCRSHLPEPAGPA